ncbi:MAG TPA: tetratricopeptide repeat protein [Gammaproteobacteria bacterium]|nr:tetratricopeptide repeat protein [Gammaproteobacteria bacterium]
MTPRALICCLCLLSLAGCAAAPRPVPAAASAPQPFRDIDQEIAYRVFMGELAQQRGMRGDAVEQYMAAARLSQDPTLASHSALLAYGDGDLRQALEAAQRWRKLAPQSNDAVHLAAVVEARSGDAEAAARDFEMLVESGADGGYMTAAHLLEQEADAAHGLPVLQAITAYAPKSADAHYALAHIAMNYKDYGLAEREARATLALDPHGDEPLVLLTRALVAQDRAGEALPMLKARVRAAGDVSLALAYGALLAEAKRDAEARQEFETILAAHPNNAEALYTLGLMTLQEKDLTAARGYFTRLLKSGKRTDDASYFLGNVAEAEKQYPEALDWYHRVQAGERWLAAQAGIGRALVKSGAPGAAGEFFDGLVANDPDSMVNLRLTEGQVFSDSGVPKQALAVYDAALSVSPGEQDLLYARALALEQDGDAAAAEHDLASILAQAPDDAEALNALGYTLTLHTTRYREAQAYIQRALVLQPDDPAFLDSMGWVEHRLGHDGLALDYLRKAYAGQADSEIAAHLVEVLLATGDEQGARALWVKARESDPDSAALRSLASRFTP